jgi:hypothetical protein
LLFPVDLPQGGIGQECRLHLIATLAGAGVKDSATFVDMRFDYMASNDTITVHSDTVGHRELVNAIGTKMSPSDTLQLEVWFLASGPFSVRTSFRYLFAHHQDTATATHQFSCGWDNRAPTGKWIFSSRDDERPPIDLSNQNNGFLIADTLEFFLDQTMTWTSTSDVTPSLGGTPSSYHATSGRLKYRVVAADTFDVEQFWGGLGGRMYRSGTTLRYFPGPGSRGIGGYAWRFDLAGSNPVLPPEPGLVVTPSDTSFTLGPNQSASRVFTITSRTGILLTFELPGWSSGGSGCGAGIDNPIFSGYTTPATMTINVHSGCAPGDGYKLIPLQTWLTRDPTVHITVTVVP